MNLLQKMTDILFHPKTKLELDSIINKKNHAVLLSGKTGIGKYTLAKFITREILGKNEKQLESYPYFLTIAAPKDSKTIGIDDIRRLTTFLQLKTTGKGAIRRLIIIEDAHNLTIAAQNALLKTLEEPPTDTMLILTAEKSDKLLPTIYSRVQEVDILIPSLEQTIVFFNNDDAQITKAYTISNGAVGVMSSILNGDNNHPILIQIEQARKILAMSTYDKLISLSEILKDKQNIENLVYSLKQIANAGLSQSADRNNKKDIKRWYKILSEIQTAQLGLLNSVSTKLVLTDLMLNI